MSKTITAGFAGFGSISYPKQIIMKRIVEARKAVRSSGIYLVGSEPVSTFSDADKTVELLRGKDFDFFIACIASWIESPIVIRVLREFIHKPILLWGLGGYTKGGSLVSPASQAGTSALCEPMRKMGFKFKFIYEHPDSPLTIDKVKNFAIAAKTVRDLSSAKIGMMGYADMGLYATMFDGVSLRTKIGPEIEVFDMLEVVQRMERINQQKSAKFIKQFKKDWKFEKPVSNETLKKFGNIYLAVDEIIRERGYSAISIKCVEGMKKYMNFPPCMILSMLGDKLPAICEDDALGLVTQLILKYLTGQSTTFVEMYEFMKDRILVGVCGFVPCAFIKGQKKVSVYGGWGGLNEGIMNTSAMKEGLVTLARLGYTGEDYYLHAVTGEGKKPRKWEELGWSSPAPQFPGLEVTLDRPVEQFAEEILSQHYLLVYGDLREQLKNFCKLLEIRYL